MQKRCIKCGLEKPTEEFNFKNKKIGRRNARCKQCTRTDIRVAYRKNRKHYLEYRAAYNKDLRKRVLDFLFNYLSNHPCVDCGETEVVILEFDHVRDRKRMAISEMVRGRHSLGVIEREIIKCDVRCRNCHARKTAREQKHYALLRTEPQNLVERINL